MNMENIGQEIANLPQTLWHKKRSMETQSRLLPKELYDHGLTVDKHVLSFGPQVASKINFTQILTILKSLLKKPQYSYPWFHTESMIA